MKRRVRLCMFTSFRSNRHSIRYPFRKGIYRSLGSRYWSKNNRIYLRLFSLRIDCVIRFSIFPGRTLRDLRREANKIILWTSKASPILSIPSLLIKYYKVSEKSNSKQFNPISSICSLHFPICNNIVKVKTSKPSIINF